jgi:hypothetical protein
LLVQKVLSSKDPDAISALGDFFHVYWDNKDYQNTNMERDRNLPNLRIAAFSLVACDMGKDCSRDSLEMTLACHYSSLCNYSVGQFLVKDLSTEQKNLLEQYKLSLLQAINSGDYRQLGLPSK